MTEFISTCSMPLAIVFLIAGFFFLVKGADVFVEGSSSIAKRFHVPAIIIGLTIVAMGTSLPETAVSVVAAIQHKNTLAISNVVGSNIFNMMVVIGFCAIMTPVAVQKATLKRDFPYSVFAALLLMILGGVGMKLGRFDSAVFLVFFAIFIGTMIRMALKAGKEGGQPQSEEIEAAEAQKVMSMPKSLLSRRAQRFLSHSISTSTSSLYPARNWQSSSRNWSSLSASASRNCSGKVVEVCIKM